MTPLHELGLKVGIEIHQQLEGEKLFCSCPTRLRDDAPNFTIARKIRAGAGEQGDIDIAAAQEQRKEKIFLYQGYPTTCLVEIDEEPPHEINQHAIYTALQFCALIHAQVSRVVQVMRKTIANGSVTSGFQRTCLLARNGYIETSSGKVRISGINLEEDAAREIHEPAKENEVLFRLDRLGIPLIEITTAADISSPEQCHEAAKQLGLLLRSLPGVKRGLGTIRQDVNISIAGGTRIEIKGAQDLRQLPQLVEFEAKRQQELLKIKKELQNVKLEKNIIIDVTPLFSSSSSKIIQKTIQNKGIIAGIKLTGFAGYLKLELQPSYRLGTELAGRAKIIAGVGGIFHSDELPNYGITESDIGNIRTKLKCSPDDAFVLVADEPAKVHKALGAVFVRAKEVLQGVPAEVRRANADATSSYLRPMPGSARMYPETDVPLIFPDVSNIKLPETLDAKIKRYQLAFSLGTDLAQFIAKSEKMELFEELVQTHPQIKPAFIAEMLTSMVLDIKRQYHQDPQKLSDDHFRLVCRYLTENKIHKDIVLPILIDMAKGTFDLLKYATLGTEQIHHILQEIVKKHPGAPFAALMGVAMKELQGKASGKFISEELKKIVEKGH